jgi:hypothetical protein
LTKDPLKKGMNPWVAALLTITIVAILGLGGWGVYKYLNRDKMSAEEVEQVVEADENAAPALEAEDVVATPAEGEVTE